MLIALFTILLLGGGGSSGLLDFVSDVRDQVKVVVEDKERRKDALKTVKAAKQKTTARTKAFRSLSKRLKAVLKSGEYTKQDIDDAWYRFFAINEQHSRESIELRFQLREQLTREEWEQIFPAGET